MSFELICKHLKNEFLDVKISFVIQMDEQNDPKDLETYQVILVRGYNIPSSEKEKYPSVVIIK